MSFDITPTSAQHDMAKRAHQFAEQVGASGRRGLQRPAGIPSASIAGSHQTSSYSPLVYPDLIRDPTGLSLPIFMEELFLGVRRHRSVRRDAGIGSVSDRPGRLARADAPVGTEQWRYTPVISNVPHRRSSNPRAAVTCAPCAPRPAVTGHWIIDGHEVCIGNGGITNVHVVYANVDRGLGHKAQALFVVPGSTPGL